MTATIPQQTGAGPFPLSFAQERFWFLQQMAPERPIFNRAQAFRLRGRLDGAALQQSLQTIVRRHAPLRSRITQEEDRLVQKVSPEAEFRLPRHQLPATGPVDREVMLHEAMTAAAGRPFDLGRDLLLRAHLWRLEEQEHVLLLANHHIAFDGWSDGLLWQELGHLYGAHARGETPELQPLPISYTDYAVWQRQHLVQSPGIAGELAYWRRQLDGLTDLELPADRPRPALQTFEGAQVEGMLAPGLLRELETLARQERVTLFMLLLAALQVLLHRYNNQDDIAVGSLITGRAQVETEPLIGCFINNLALRSDLSGNPTLRQLLSRVRRVALQAYDHQQIPFEQLLQALQPARDTSRSPLFQVALNMLALPFPPPHLPGLKVESLARVRHEAHFDLTFYIRRRSGQSDEGLPLALVYSVDLFGRASAQAIMAQLEHLLAQMAVAPDRAIRSYSLVTPAQRALLPDPQQALAEPYYEPVTSQIDAWAERAPQAIAVEWQEQSWTYRQLGDSAQALARVLLAAGLAQGDVVALSGPRSFGLINGMLAVFYSGAVLLIVDPELPRARLQFVLRAAKARCLLYVGRRREADAWLDGLLPVIGINALTGEADRPAGAVASTGVVRPGDPAYIFFTSGSTGAPKGVLGGHKSISHIVAWQRQTFAVGPQDRCAQLAAPSFDLFLRDVCLPLTSGATLVLPAVEQLETAPVLTWLRRERIGILNAVPSVAQRWFQAEARPPAGGVERLDHLRCVFFTGEALTDAHVNQWREVCGESTEMVNYYGLTETTLVKTYYPIPAELLPGGQPIGWPLPQTQALILNNGRLAGVGEAGEIVMRTPFRSLAYINAPELNEERFVANPFRDDPGDLLYYTGDLGRYRTDGYIQFLGRGDRQLKVSGVRIEPGEIEAVLERHPAVWSSHVAAATVGEQQRLVAWVAASTPITATDLRRHCAAHLPPHTIPAYFVILDELPLLANGKVDRRGLPTPPAAPPPDGQSSYLPPATAVEEKIAAIWADVLELPRIGARDNFFDLGGHSLLASQVIARIAREHGIDLPVRALFEDPTVAGLARYLDGVQPGPGRSR